MSGLKLKLKNKQLQQTQEKLNDRKEGVSKPDAKVIPLARNSREETQESSEGVNLKYSRNDENKRKKSNRYFYRVSNHHELFKIGRSFYTDYLSGMKSFAITSTGYQASQQKSILGLASFFDHKEDIKIGIISDNLSRGAFKDIVSISKKVDFDMFGLGQNLTIHSFYNHFEFINMDELLSIVNEGEFVNADDLFDQVVDMYDVVFWDVPELHKIQTDSEHYFPAIMKFESISIIVAKSLSKKSDIDDIKKFFQGYGINLKGLLLEDKNTEEKEQANNDLGPTQKKADKKDEENNDKPWWRRSFFK